MLAEYTEFVQNQQSWTKTNIYLGDGLIATNSANGTTAGYTEYHHPDRLGTKLITNDSLGTAYEQAHLPFGTALNAESTITNNNKRFTSYERSTPTGLDYAVNRTYDSKQGRFTQVDPIGMQAVSLAAPQTLNLYVYCGNDPINHTDPEGLFFGKLFRWIGRILNKISKILFIAVVVATALIVFAPAESLVWKAAMWFVFKGLPVMMKYAGWAIGGKLGVGSIYRTAGANASLGGWVFSAFANDVVVDGGQLATVTVKISWWERVNNWLCGFPDGLLGGIPSYIDRWRGIDRGTDFDSLAYKIGWGFGTMSSLLSAVELIMQPRLR